MQQWEHATVVTAREDMDSALKEASFGGWEMVGFSMEDWDNRGVVNTYRLVFKRSIEGSPDQDLPLTS